MGFFYLIMRYWYIQNDGSDEFFNIVLPFFNQKTYPEKFIDNFNYYGFDDNDSDWKKGYNCADNPEYFKNKPVLIDIETFKKKILVTK